MEKKNHQDRIVRIHKMLFEMARGNFTYRIPLGAIDDEMETLVVLINMVAEELQESIFHFGSPGNPSIPSFVAQTCLVLDSSFSIKSFTPEVLSYLGYSELNLIDQPLSYILSDYSLEKFHNIMETGTSLPAAIALDFKTKEELLISVSCSIGLLINRSEILLNLITPFFEPTLVPQGRDYGKQVKNRKSDAVFIQKLYDYILANLEEPLPSLKELSRKFGTNEYKLKDGFRHFFKTSIYQFYNDERLKRAHFMIEQTSLPLKNISVMNGFTNYPNFSKAFKKRFGFSPNELKRSGTIITPPLED